MNELESTAEFRFSETTLLVLDAGGRVQAVSSGSATDQRLDRSSAHKHYAEVFGRDSKWTYWLSEQMNAARKQEDYRAEASFENGRAPLTIRLESLKSDGELYGFAVCIFPGDPASVNPLPTNSQSRQVCLEEGDALVTRQQWHDIKNHLGGLKLYATFLKRKMPEGDDRQTIEKMLNGIDTLIEHLARIRKGEAKNGG